MKVIREGHKYELENFEVGGSLKQTIQFIEKEPHPHPTFPGEMITIHNGTTNEDLLKLLIDRMQFLQSKFPCKENAIVITNLEESLMWLEKRTADRLMRNVEGKHLS